MFRDKGKYICLIFLLMQGISAALSAQSVAEKSADSNLVNEEISSKTPLAKSTFANLPGTGNHSEESPSVQSAEPGRKKTAAAELSGVKESSRDDFDPVLLPEIPWRDKVFAMGLNPQFYRDFNSSMSFDLGMHLRWWPVEHLQLAAEGTLGSFSSIALTISYWTNTRTTGFFIGAGGGGGDRSYSGLAPLLFVTTGLDFLVDKTYILGLRINGGYLFKPANTFFSYLMQYDDYNQYYISAALSANFIVNRTRLDDMKKSLGLDRGITGYPLNSPERKSAIRSLSEDGQIAQGRIDLLLKKNMPQEFRKVKSTAMDLPQEDRDILYQIYKKEPVLPVVLNILLGFGIGSGAQGDKPGAAIALVSDVTSVGLLAFLAVPDMDYRTKTILGVSGGILAVASRITQIILPIVYSNSYNKKLGESLLISVNWIPLIHIAQVASANSFSGSIYGAALTAHF